MVKVKRNVVMFTILAVGAIYFLHEDLRKLFTPELPESELNLDSDESTAGYIGRKLLALNSNVNEYSVELKTDSNSFVKEKLNTEEKLKKVAKSIVSYNKLGRNWMRKLSRRKRDANHNNFGWKLNLNVSNNKNPSERASNSGTENDLHSKSKKEKFLNMAVQMEGGSHDNSLKEMHQAWDSLGLLLRRLYGKNALKEGVRDIDELSTESTDIVSPDSITEKTGLSIESNDIASPDSSTEKSELGIESKGIVSPDSSTKKTELGIESKGIVSPDSSTEKTELGIESKGIVSPDSSTEKTELGIESKGIVSPDSSTEKTKLSTESNDLVSPDLSTEKPERERTPKFLFGLLNFGSSVNPPLEANGTNLGNENSSENATSPKTDVQMMEVLTSAKSVLSTNNTEMVIENLGTEEPISVEPRIGTDFETFKDLESTTIEFGTQLAGQIEKTSFSPIKVTTIDPEPSFTSDQLKEFCISLLSRIHASPQSVDNFLEDDGSGQLDMMGNEVEETMTVFQPLSTDVPKEATTKSTNQRFGIWASIWNRFTGRSLVQNPINVNVQSSTLIPKIDTMIEKVNDAFSLKNESSTVLGNFDSTESDNSVFIDDEGGSALTVTDCESFFRQIQNDAVFSKPNLLDVINNPMLLSLDPSQFNFPELRNKQMRSMKSALDSPDPNFQSNLLSTEEMTNDLNTPFSSVKSASKELSDEFSVDHLPNEQRDENLFENTVLNQDLLSTPISFDTQERIQSGTFDKSTIDDLIIENGKDSRKPATEIALISDKFTTIHIQSSTELLENEFFDDRASTAESSEVSADIDGRIFGILSFGSGERNLEDSDDITTQNVSEFSENRSFHPDLQNFASGDSELIEAFSMIEKESTTTSSVTELDIFDVGINLRKKESLMNNTESDTFDINENQLKSTTTPDEKPRIDVQFDSKEKPTESNITETNMLTPSIFDHQTPLQNIFDEKLKEFQFESKEKLIESNITETNMPTQSIFDDQTPIQNVFDEKKIKEFQFDPEEVFSESQNVVLDSTNKPVTKSILEDGIPLQNVSDEGSRIFPGMSNFLGSGDGRELSEVSTDPELGSESSECLDCFKNKSSSLSIDDYDDFGSDTNDTGLFIGEKSSIAIDSLSSKTVSDTSVHDDTIYTNKVDAFSESNLDSSEFSTLPSPKNLIPSEANNHELQDYFENIDHEVTNYDYYGNSKDTGYEMTNYEYHENSKNYDYGITTFQTVDHIHIEDECDEIHSNIKSEAFSANPTTAITVPKDQRFMDTLFLTGSGAGGLFGNDDGEINLVQEPDTTSFPFPSPVSPRQSRRGGRMDDSSFVTWPAEKNHVLEKHTRIPEEEKGFSTDLIPHLNTLGSIRSVEDGSNNPKFIEDTTRTSQDLSSEAVTAINIPENSFVFPKKKAKDLPPRYCNHAGECNIASNEGCITKKGRGVCDCRRSFVRHPETDICESPFMLKTSLKLPGEIFHEDLKDKHSELYRNKTRDAIDTMWLVVYQDPTLEYSLADIDVAGFEEGSLVIHWKLTFAVRNENISRIVHEVDEKLEETFKHQAVLKSAPLNVENVKLLSYSDINPCKERELNYCSKDADCIRDAFLGFRCRCADGYLDNSKNPMYPGETCIAVCPPDYCGKNGYCEARSNGEKQCLCNGWYFGEKCDISGILVISCFAGANCVLIVLVLAIVFFCKRRRQRRTRFYENNQITFQENREPGPFGRVSPRLAASIALDELAPNKRSKYMAISTPMYMKPDIHITSPSIIGSSISYDYDSTFDRTPSAEVNMDPPKYDSVPEVPKYNSVPEV